MKIAPSAMCMKSQLVSLRASVSLLQHTPCTVRTPCGCRKVLSARARSDGDADRVLVERDLAQQPTPKRQHEHVDAVSAVCRIVPAASDEKARARGGEPARVDEAVGQRHVACFEQIAVRCDDGRNLLALTRVIENALRGVHGPRREVAQQHKEALAAPSQAEEELVFSKQWVL